MIHSPLETIQSSKAWLLESTADFLQGNKVFESGAGFFFFLNPQPDSIESIQSDSIYLCWLSGKLLSGFSCSVVSIVG